MSDKEKVRPVEYVGTGGVGAWFGVPAHTVSQWIRRYADTLPTPPPDVLIAGPKPVPGWLPAREREWRAWEASRPRQDHGRGGRRKAK
jgi:hypothetical protein